MRKGTSLSATTSTYASFVSVRAGVITVTVADDGVGTQPSDRPGAGMGSRLVRALAAQLGGHVETIAPPGDGTLHQMRFPVVAPGDAEYARLHH